MAIENQGVYNCRVILMLMFFLCFLIVSSQRVNLGIALIFMVNWLVVGNHTDELCPKDEDNYGRHHTLSMASLSAMMGRWLPKKFLPLHASYMTCAIPVGAFLTLLGASALYKDVANWPSLHLIPGILGIVWSIVWLYLCFDSRFFQVLDSGQRHAAKFLLNGYPIPVLEILMSKPFWGYVFAGIGSHWIFIFNIFIMPMCIHLFFGIEMIWNGLICAFANVMLALVYLVSSTISDRMLQNKVANVSAVRKTTTCAGMATFSFCMVALTFVGCNKAVGLIFMVVAVGGSGLSTSALTLMPSDMSPNFSGIVSCMMNTIGSLLGCFLPVLVAQLTTERSNLKGWDKVFYASFFLCFISTILCMAFSRSETQPWNTPQKPRLAVVEFI